MFAVFLGTGIFIQNAYNATFLLGLLIVLLSLHANVLVLLLQHLLEVHLYTSCPGM